MKISFIVLLVPLIIKIILYISMEETFLIWMIIWLKGIMVWGIIFVQILQI